MSSSASEPALSAQLVPTSPSDSTDAVYRLHSVSSVELEDQLSSLLEERQSSPTLSVRRKDYRTPREESLVDFKGDSGIDPGMCFRRSHDSCNEIHTPLTTSAAPFVMTTPTWSSQHSRQMSDCSDYSFTLPTPSYAWAPPPSPVLLPPSPISSPSCLRGVPVGVFNGYSSSSPDASPVLKQRSLSDSGSFGLLLKSNTSTDVRERDREEKRLCSKFERGMSANGVCGSRRLSSSLDSGKFSVSRGAGPPVVGRSGSIQSVGDNVRKLYHFRTAFSTPNLTFL